MPHLFGINIDYLGYIRPYKTQNLHIIPMRFADECKCVKKIYSEDEGYVFNRINHHSFNKHWNLHLLCN